VVTLGNKVSNSRKQCKKLGKFKVALTYPIVNRETGKYLGLIIADKNSDGIVDYKHYLS
jgi:hypothetical protein